jgi:hypothetical protein
LGTLALGRTLNFVNLAIVVLRVDHLEEAVALKAEIVLIAVTIFEKNAFISGIFVPRATVFINIEVGLELGLAAEAEAPLALNCIKQ